LKESDKMKKENETLRLLSSDLFELLEKEIKHSNSRRLAEIIKTKTGKYIGSSTISNIIKKHQEMSIGTIFTLSKFFNYKLDDKMKEILERQVDGNGF
jgi:hypothetical protein